MNNIHILDCTLRDGGRIINCAFPDADIKDILSMNKHRVNKAKLENEFKLYLTKQIITEEINYETYSSKSITYNPKAQDYIKKIQSYNISFPSNNEGSITLDKKVFEKIFSLMNLCL